MNGPYKMHNLVYEWVDFSKFAQIYWLKFKNTLEKSGNVAQNLTKNWTDWYNGHFFLKNWYLYGSAFKFRSGTSLPKPNL